MLSGTVAPDHNFHAAFFLVVCSMFFAGICLWTGNILDFPKRLQQLFKLLKRVARETGRKIGDDDGILKRRWHLSHPSQSGHMLNDYVLSFAILIMHVWIHLRPQQNLMSIRNPECMAQCRTTSEAIQTLPL